jgi:hypothetical protein
MLKGYYTLITVPRMIITSFIWIGLDLCPFIRAFIYTIHTRKIYNEYDWYLARIRQNIVYVSKTTHKKLNSKQKERE